MDNEQQKKIRLEESRRQSAEETEEAEYLDEPLEEDEIEELKINPPEEPLFPIIIFGLAVLKDILDWFTAGWLGWLLALFLGGIIGIWIFLQTGFVMKRILKRLILPAILAFIVAVIPYLNFVPESSAFVLIIHYSEKREAKKILKLLKKIEVV